MSYLSIAAAITNKPKKSVIMELDNGKSNSLSIYYKEIVDINSKENPVIYL